jgi:nitrite reductase/ring-hydroxylating ferredoxin subunit
MPSGWVLAGFADELPGEVTDVVVDGRPVLLVRQDGRLRAFDGVCPHRGARLGRGGTRVGERVVCPFHGHRIRLGSPADAGDRALCVAEMPAVEVGELVFVKTGAATPDCGFARAITDLKAGHAFVHGFAMPLPVPPAMVVENAFDTAHFGPVHGVPHASALTVAPFDPQAGQPLLARGQFRAAASPWDPEPDGTPIAIPYEARAYAPGLILSAQLGGSPYRFLVGAIADGHGGSVARVVLMVPRTGDGGGPDMARVEWLLDAMESQLAADRAIWADLPADPPRRLQPGEEAVAAFWAFCDHFAEAPSEPAPVAAARGVAR